MAISQARLRAAYGDRISRIRAMGMSDGAAPGSGGAEPDPVRAVAVVRDFDVATFVRSGYDFSSALSAELGHHWHRSFTRTVFLAGNPVNLAARFPATSLSDDSSVAWFEPAPMDGHATLRRLLRPFRGPAGVPEPARVSVRLSDPPLAGGRAALLVVATGGLRVEDYLIHVNHLVAECVLAHALEQVETLEVHHVDEIDEYDERCSYVRVTPTGNDPTLLRCHAYLTIDPC